MSNCKMHNVRFYNPKPEAIYCLAFQKLLKKLAVVRANTSIEIWNLAHCPYIERTIPCIHDNYSVESAAWCGERLFSVGLHGFLVEYNLRTLMTKRILSVTGEAAFCLDVSSDNKYIAVGTEKGYLNIFKVEEDDVLFEKFLDKQEGHILCLKYDPSGKYVASGGEDAIRVWDIQTGHALHKMTTGRSETNKVTVVWCLHILSDLTIISGDSRGKLTFWDGNLGAQIESYRSHRADILALCVSEDEQSLYCAGADPNIVNYVRVNVKADNYKWVKSIQRKIHDHDVRSLILYDEKLYSGGVDGYLACSYHPPKTLLKYSPFLQNCVDVCKESRIIVLKYPKHVDVWLLGIPTDTHKQFTGLVSLNANPKHLLTLQRIVKGDKNSREGVVCCTASSDGKWIAFSTDAVLRLFRFNFDDIDKPELIPVDNLPEECCASLQVVFTKDNLSLITAPQEGGLRVFSLREGTPLLSQSIDTRTYLKDTITFLKTSLCGRYLLAADPQSHIVVWIMYRKQWHLHCQLPNYQSSPTAVTIRSGSPAVVMVAYADHKIVEYDLQSNSFTSFSKQLTKQHPKNWPNRTFAVRNITFDPRQSGMAILHDDSNIVIIDENKPLSKTQTKIPKLDSNAVSDSNDSSKFSNNAIHAIKKYKHLVHLDWLSNDELVAVEVNPNTLLEQLPPCLVQNTFGTK